MNIVPGDEKGIRHAARVILNSGVVAYPLDSGYVLGCLPSDPDATKKICEIRERALNPLPLICGETEMARRVVHFNSAAELLAKTFWPGPLTLVLKSKVKYPMWVTHGKNSLAICVPGNKVAVELAKYSKGVIVASSAKRKGEKIPKSAKEVWNRFRGKIDLILDTKTGLSDMQSTILDLSGDELWILRSGPVSGRDIKNALSS